MNRTTLIVFIGAAAIGYFFAEKVASIPGVSKAYEMGANIG